MAGTRKPVRFVSDLSFSVRKALCQDLDMTHKWRELADAFKYDSEAINKFAYAVYRLPGFNSPTEDLLSEYCHRNPTLDELYFTLSRLNLISAAKLIEQYASKPVRQQAEDAQNPRRTAGEDSDQSQVLPTPSQQRIPLKPHNNIQTKSQFGYTQDPFSDSNNSSGSPAPTGQGQGHIGGGHDLGQGQLYPSPGSSHFNPHNHQYKQYDKQPHNYGCPQHYNVVDGIGRPVMSPYAHSSSNGGDRHLQYGYQNGGSGRNYEYQGSPNPHDLGSANPMPVMQKQMQQQQQHPVPSSKPLASPLPNTQPDPVLGGPDRAPVKLVGGGVTDLRNSPPLLGLSGGEGEDLTFDLVRRAAYGFDPRYVISQDRFGAVYKGRLGEQWLAVKQVNKVKDDVSGFDISVHLAKEVELLRKCNHKNIMRLLQYLSAEESDGMDYLIYPYMDRGSLRKNLAAKDSQMQLKWEYRVKILLQAASGLVYLHTEVGEQPYIHGDVSSENILLDSNLTAKLSGFGLARAATGGAGLLDNGGGHVMHTHVSHVSQSYIRHVLFGAQEYLPPEFTDMPQLSVKGDVFAFGVVMLETCTGLPGYDERREGAKRLWEYITQLTEATPDMTSFMDSLNDRRQPMPPSVWEKVFKLGRQCVATKKKHRPTSSEVHQTLNDIFEQEVRTGAGRKNSGNEGQLAVGGYRPYSARQEDNILPESPFEPASPSPASSAPSPGTPSPARYSIVAPDFGQIPVPAGRAPTENTTRTTAATSNAADDSYCYEVTGPSPPASTQYPVTRYTNTMPYAGASAAHPIASTPYPVASMPYPVTSTPYSAAQRRFEEEYRAETTEIVFERPGNTCEIPVFAYEQRVTDNARPALLEVCPEQDSLRHSSAGSSACAQDGNHGNQLNPEFDHTLNALSILTGGSSACTSLREDSRPQVSAEAATADKNQSEPDETGGDDEVQEAERVEPETPDKALNGFDFRKNDLDVLSGSSPIQSAKFNMADWRPSKTLSVPGGHVITESKKPGSASAPGSTNPSLTGIIQLQPVEKHAISRLPTVITEDEVETRLSEMHLTADDIQNKSNMAESNMATGMLSSTCTTDLSCQIGSFSVDILHPPPASPLTLPGGVTSAPTLTSYPAKSAAIFTPPPPPPLLDDNVQINDSVLFFAGNESRDPLNTTSELDFSFKHDNPSPAFSNNRHYDVTPEADDMTHPGLLPTPLHDEGHNFNFNMFPHNDDLAMLGGPCIGSGNVDFENVDDIRMKAETDSFFLDYLSTEGLGYSSSEYTSTGLNGQHADTEDCLSIGEDGLVQRGVGATKS